MQRVERLAPRADVPKADGPAVLKGRALVLTLGDIRTSGLAVGVAHCPVVCVSHLRASDHQTDTVINITQLAACGSFIRL